ncbi:MAG: thiamine pyrophosphate-binding protein [Nannocystaceae bacterium]|nr:thiamine pyrophosphate-binding protein [Nannocystaceae bacterium]
MNGGELIAEVLKRQGVEFLFTLCGGHISPILVGAKARGIQVVDVRHEANAVFAADAVSRMTGVPGVAAVTAGPGVTNTITAIKNAQMAQSPLVLLGGATATILKGRGALQDIDQMALISPHVKFAAAVTRVRDLPRTLERAFEIAQEGVPGPVFVECPVDLLYDEPVVREMFGAKSASQVKGPGDIALQLYLRYYLAKTFAGSQRAKVGAKVEPDVPTAFPAALTRAADLLGKAKRPVIVVGSQATVGGPLEAERLAESLGRLGVPVYLSGMARGLMGAKHDVWFRHKRTQALGEADLVILAGVPNDFRLNYGLQIARKATLISINRSAVDIRKNRKPKLGAVADPCDFLCRLSAELTLDTDALRPWLDRLLTRDRDRNEQIQEQSEVDTGLVNPLAVCQSLEDNLADDSILVADGGDFVATASYILSPRSPLSWLDPGPFGTLGVGAGFALGAKLCRPNAEVWLLYGDGSAGYTIPEFDTFVRHGLPVIAVVGNDASWAQIARDQVELLKDDVGTVLARTDYHKVAEGFGAKGLLLDDPANIESTIAEAKALAAQGHPVLINAHIGKTEFRKGSMSM